MTSSESEGGRAGTPAHIWRFANVEMDERVFELRVAGVPVDSERTPLRVLRVLLEQPRLPVSQQELLERVWRRSPDTLSRSALPNAIRKLRKAIGDEASSLIVTVAGGGYLLAADVERKELPPLPSLERILKAGALVPHRPDWRLRERIDATDSSEVWLAEHLRNHHQRVFKFAGDGFHLTALRREVTIGRLLFEALGERPEFVRIHDWNLDQPPYFIECDFGGLDLNRWAQSRGGLAAVPLAERLDIAAAMAEGVAIAHAVGVLHKDLKPANVLIDTAKDGKPGIRLADFGSGRLLEPEVLDQYNITRVNLPDADPTGTPLYIAPELLEGHPPTTASDIYALGVLLYQLVVGDFRKPISQGWEADIGDELLREDIAAATQGNPQKRLASATLLAERLTGLAARRTGRAKDRRMRAQSQAALDALKRSNARRPWLIGAGVLMLAALLSLSWLYQQASQARDQARRQFSISQAVNRFLDRDLVAQANPHQGGNPDVRLRDALQKAEDQAQQRFSSQPETEGSLRLALGQAWFGISDYARAADEFRQAGAAFGKSADSASTTDANTLASLNDRARLGLALSSARLSNFKGAQAELDAAHADLETRKPVDSELFAEFHRVSGAVAMLKFDFKNAAQSFQLALDDAQHSPDFDQSELDQIRDGLAEALARTGELSRALVIAKDLGKELEGRKGASAYSILKARMTEGTIYLFQSNYLECVRVFDSLVAGFTQAAGAQNEETLTAMEDLSNCEYGLQHWEKSAGLERQVYTQLLTKLGRDNGHTMSAALNLGAVLARTGENNEAIALLEPAHAAAETKFGVAHPLTESAAFFLADALLGKGQPERAAQLLAAVSVEVMNSAAPQNDWPGQIAFESARVQALGGHHEEAKRLFRTALENLEKFDAADFWMTLEARKYLDSNS